MQSCEFHVCEVRCCSVQPRPELPLVFHFLWGTPLPYMCVCRRECLCVRSLRVHAGLQGWDVRLITAGGCYEISLHSSFVPVWPILLCSRPDKPCLTRTQPLCSLFIWLYCIWCALIYSGVGDDVCCCRDGQTFFKGRHVTDEWNRWITNEHEYWMSFSLTGDPDTYRAAV